MDIQQTYPIFVGIMKKLLASVLLLAYITATCGVVVNFHYCMEKLASTSLFSGDSKVCGKCGMHSDASNGCCRDESKIVKMEQDQVKASFADLQIKAPEAQAPNYVGFSAIQPIQTEDHSWTYYSPPLLSFQDSYLQNRVFRI
jgi:hypothetical protein